MRSATILVATLTLVITMVMPLTLSNLTFASLAFLFLASNVGFSSFLLFAANFGFPHFFAMPPLGFLPPFLLRVFAFGPIRVAA